MYWKSITPFMVVTQTCIRYCVHLTFHHNWLLVQSKNFLFLYYRPWLSVYIAASDSDIIQVDFKILTKSLHKESKLLLPGHIMTSNYNCFIAHSSYCIAWHVHYHTSRKLEFWLTIFFSILCETYVIKMKIAAMSCKCTGVRNTETDKVE